MELTIEDLVRAYYKAKVDLYYSNDDRALELVMYEEKLSEKLGELFRNIVDTLAGSQSYEEFVTPDFLGSGILMGKGSTFSEDNTGLGAHSDPLVQWKNKTQQGPLEIEFRVLSRCSINMHILSTIWVEKIGARIDSALGVEQPPHLDDKRREQQSSAYGNRLRRNRRGDLNAAAPGTLKPYLHQYERWQRNGYQAISEALVRGETAVVITSDVRAFFPSIDPTFLLENDFLCLAGLDALGEGEKRLHKLFVESLVQWRKLVANDLEIPKSKVGLPLGLAASGVVANGALLELDKLVREEINPLFYGRYVDDLTIVLKGNDQFVSDYSVIEWIIKRIGSNEAGEPILEQLRSETEKGNVKYARPYLKSSEIVFAKKKSKVHFFEGESGHILLEAVKRSDQERASEWRELPDLPDNPGLVGRELVSVLDSEGAAANTLRNAALPTIKRAEFALKLRNVEAYAKDLDPDTWKAHRREFFQSVEHFVLTPSFFLEFEGYLPRIIDIALDSGDWSALYGIIRALGTVHDELQKLAEKKGSRLSVKINGQVLGAEREDQALLLWKMRTRESVLKTLIRNVRVDPNNEWTKILEALKSLEEHPAVITAHAERSLMNPAQSFELKDEFDEETYLRFFESDLASTPFRASVLPKGWFVWQPDNESSGRKSARVSSNISEEGGVKSRIEAFRFLSTKASQYQLRTTCGVMFPTRPASFAELLAATRLLSSAPSGEEEKSVLVEAKNAITAFRGYSLEADEMPEIRSRGQGDSVLISAVEKRSDLPAFSGNKKTVEIALGMLSTSREQLSKSIHGSPNLSRKRYSDIISLVNEIIREESKVDYLVLPELSIPIRWYMRIANKLRSVGISLIAGVEYQHSSRAGNVVHNQVWASLAHNDWGFPSNIVYIQDKLRPAHGEELNLLAEAQKHMLPELPWKPIPVIQHKGFRFSLLICSELTNINYRAAARGNVDALIIPQWNQDTETFGAIVESAAFDVHCYVVQANNRRYGDTRIRGPLKERYQRDIVKVSGGSRDRVIVGSLDIAALRQFQSHHNLMDKPVFKPLPDGFAIDPERCWLSQSNCSQCINRRTRS